MPLPSLKRISFSAPPPKIALLPDSLFFVRPVPVDSAASAADVNSRVELALEGLAPFPLAQMYYGHHWIAGAKHALVFAAYRKRFTAEQTDSWQDAEGVIPIFASLLGRNVDGATTILLTSEEGMTGIHWNDPTDVPSVVLTRNWPVEATEPERVKVRDALIRDLGGSKTIVDLTAPPVLDPGSSSGETIFQSGSVKAVYSQEELDALDIRDKDDLAARRRARARDLLLWRVFVGSAAALALALLLEVSMFGGRIWQKTRLAQRNRQDTPVTEILTKENVATRIEELSTKRLLPFEMLDEVASKMPAGAKFIVNATARDLDKLVLDCQAPSVGDAVPFNTALNADPLLQKVELVDPRSQNNKYIFQLVVTFKPGVLTPKD